MSLPVAINARAISAPLTGVQRYVQQITAHLPAPVAEIRPPFPSRGPGGHAWEQAVLPIRLHGRLLWSPSNTGPLAVSRQVLTIHDVVPLDHPEWLNPRFAAWYRFLLPRLVRRVRRIIAVSAFTRERLLARTGADPAKIVVIHLGLDSRFCPQPPQALAAMRAALRLPPGPYVLSLGSLEPRKNLPALLAAWEVVSADSPGGPWLVIAGAPGPKRIFAGSAPAPLPPRTFYTGRVEDCWLPALYAGARAFCYPSLYEGFGIPPLEAMGCGTPVLTGDAAVFPEILGDAALQANARDPDGLAAALRQMLDSPRLCEELRGRGLRRAATFQWGDAAARTWEVLQSAAAEG